MNLPTYPELQAKASELGFQKLGCLTLPDMTLEAEQLKNWLAQGFHGEMQWMADQFEKRQFPQQLMPETKTVLCVAMNYYPGELPNNAQAKIARYAQGDDYHDVLKKQLRLLLTWLQTFDTGIEGKPLTDSAPIMEKALARKAGLGWQGKHSNLITRDRGSWVFLGELLLNITFPDTPPADPMDDLCGKCRRCIDACPTDAIVSDGVVDANRCISYWTIEYKGEEIPQPIADNMQGWIFGCDICQEVCPWNIKFAQETSIEAFLPRPWNLRPDLTEIQQLTDEEFKVRYRKSPVKRTKLKGLLRNVRAMLEQSRDLPAP